MVATFAISGRAAAQSTISGTVFEDVNYGGGAGRPYVTANTSAIASGFASNNILRPGARVELYDNTGAFVSSTTTNALGVYTFSGLMSGNYTVRVVNATVSSSRPGIGGGLVPVQTFRTKAGADDVNRVGGENPAVADSGPNGALVVTTVTTGNNINLAFTGQETSTNDKDNTMFLDNVEVLSGGIPLGVNPIANPGFETGTLAGTKAPGYQNNPSAVTGVAWTFNAQSGIQANESKFTPPNTGSGSRAAFLQSIPGSTGAVNQSFNLPVGTYTVRFAAANRVFGKQQTVGVTVNGSTVLAGLQAVSGTYATYQTAAFTVVAAVPLNSLVAQSQAPVTVAAVPVTGVDFGYSFDVINNTNDAGQGSVRQFLLNANALTNANLAQAGQVVGRETSIFMIPNGATTSVPAGLTSGLASGLNASSGINTWARTALTSALPTLTDPGTTLDGSTQTTNVQDSNPGQVGLGGSGGQFVTVGTEGIPFAQFDRPEVEAYGLSTLANVLLINANTSIVRGLALHGAASTVEASNVTGLVIENNLIGTTAFVIADPTLTLANSASNYGVRLGGGTLGVAVRHNVVGFCSYSGVYLPSGGTVAGSDVLLVRNELAQNGFRITGGDNVTVGDGGNAGPVRIVYNLLRTSNSDGVQFDIGRVATSGTRYNVVRNNTFFDSGNGGASSAKSQLEGGAILYLQRSKTSPTTGTNADSLYFNVINQTQAGGIVVGYGQRGVIISRNSTYFNGTPFNKPTGGNLGIDLIPNSSYAVNGNQDYGNGDGVTPNTGTLTTAFGNAGMNYPILTLATATSSTSASVNVQGYVGTAPGQTTFAGATVEFYTADNVQANNNGAVSTINPTIIAHGEGRTYVGSLTCDANGNFSGTLTVPSMTPPLSGDAITGSLTATAYLVGQGTSEFGPNRPIIVSADVEATITANSGPTTAGSTGTFTVSFANQSFYGPVTASGVIASVQLSPGLSGVSATNGGSYNSITGLVTYSAYSIATPGSLATGSSFVSVISYTQPASAPVTATAAITTTTNEAGQTANNTFVATNNTILRFDATTTISGPATVTAGNQVAYDVTTTSVGGISYPSAAPLVVQTVSVPVGASNVFVTGGGVVTGSSGAGYTVTYAPIVALAAGQSITNTVTFTAPANNYSVGAGVSSSPADAVSTNNSASAATTVNAAGTSQANVFALISASPTSAAPGSPISFTVTQGNRGPNPATGVSTTVVIAPGLPISGAGAVTINGNGPTSFSGSTATYSGGTTYNSTTGLVTFPTVNSQPPGVASNVTYAIGFNAPASGVTTATVAVQTTSPDFIPADNQATAQVTVTPTAPADLMVTLSGPSGATVGQILSYTLTTTNNGPASATGIGQTLNLPAGLPVNGFQQLTINGAGPTSISGSTATYVGGTTYSTITGLLTIAPVATLGPVSALITTIGYSAPANGDLSLTTSASITSTSPDPNLTNNSAGLTTTLLASADVQVTLTGVGQISPGDRITYGVTAFNNGPSAAPGVATSVSLPAFLPITGPNAVLVNSALPSTISGSVATYPDGSTYDNTTGIVRLPNLSTLQAGTSGLNTVSFVLPSAYIGTLVSTATAVVTGITDPISSNNTAVVQPSVVPSSGNSNIGTAISGPATVTAGQPVVFTMTTTSPGAPSTGVLQFVQLPPGLTANSGTITVTLGGIAVAISYDPTSGLLTLPATNLGAGGTLTYTINVSNAPGSGPLLATATVNSNELDSNPANNQAVASVAITPATSLSVSVVGPARALAGTNVSYLITTANGGPSTATGATQTVTVPTGATNVQLNGLSVTPGTGGVLILPIPATLVPGGTNTVSNILSFTVSVTAGSSLTVPTTLSATGPGSPASANGSQITIVSSPAPIARNVVNTAQAPEGNTANAPLPISPLSGLAQGNATLVSYTITTLPLATQGILYVWNGIANVLLSPGAVLTPTDAANLRFQPASGFSGNATFTYLTTDNATTPSNEARYLVPVGPDTKSAYARPTTTKGGNANQYVAGDVLAYGIDPNAAQYNTAGLIYNPLTGGAPSSGTGPVNNGIGSAPSSGTGSVNNGIGSASISTADVSLLAAKGIQFSFITGLFTVSNPSLLPRAGVTLSDITVTTVDLLGGVNTNLVTLITGAYPLPVELSEFTAIAYKNVDAQLAWRTASEKNNDHFDVERSLNGTDFEKIGQVKGQGTTISPTAYTLTDAGIGAKVNSAVYYRLKQVDADGTVSFSPVRTVAFSHSLPTTFTVAPNPAHENTVVDLRSMPVGTYQLSLFDATGRLLRQLKANGGNAYTVDVQMLASGIYLLRLSGVANDGTPINISQRLTKE